MWEFFFFTKKTQFEKNLNTIILYNTNQKLNRKDANGMIEVKNLVKKYGNQFAVNDISFTVEELKYAYSKDVVRNIVSNLSPESFLFVCAI